MVFPIFSHENNHHNTIHQTVHVMPPSDVKFSDRISSQRRWPSEGQLERLGKHQTWLEIPKHPQNARDMLGKWRLYGICLSIYIYIYNVRPPSCKFVYKPQ